jgi:outer membrane lipoprotein
MKPLLGRVGALAGLVFLLPLAHGCVSSQWIPSDMESRIDRNIPFESLKTEPEKFKGRLVVLGGQVLHAKRLKEGTQVEVLQLPLDSADAPIATLTESKGRFLAYYADFLDPATLPAGTMVSMVAEVTGSKTQPLDEVEYTYPTVKISTLKVWPESEYRRAWPHPYYNRYPYYPYFPFFYPYYGWGPWY